MSQVTGAAPEPRAAPCPCAYMWLPTRCCDEGGGGRPGVARWQRGSVDAAAASAAEDQLQRRGQTAGERLKGSVKVAVQYKMCSRLTRSSAAFCSDLCLQAELPVSDLTGYHCAEPELRFTYK